MRITRHLSRRPDVLLRSDASWAARLTSNVRRHVKLISEPKKEWRLLQWLIPPATFVLALVNWRWWLDDQPFQPFLSLFMVFGLAAFAFEVGFKYFRVSQRRSVFFILAFICPLVLAVLGVFGGFLFAGVV